MIIITYFSYSEYISMQAMTVYLWEIDQEVPHPQGPQDTPQTVA